jgi:DNA-binding MarR family transcriptional regulator
MSQLVHETLVVRIRAAIDRILALEKRRVFEVDGQRIHPSEAHLMLLVAREPSINATGIAERLGLTKGAVSQTLTRLERKGLLTKSRDTSRRNELVIEFTTLGKRAISRFRRLETTLAKRLDRHLAGLAEGERRTIGAFLERFGEILGEVR